MRDIIVGYVRVPNVRFGKERYDVYYKRLPNFKPDCNFDGHDGKVWYKVDNNDIATADNGGELTFKRPGTVALTATCNANKNYAKVECSTTVNMMRDRVTFTAVGLPDVLFSNTPHNLRDYLYNSKTQSGEDFYRYNPGFSVTSSNSSILRCDDHKLLFGGTSGEATITLKQEQNNYYEAASISHTLTVARCDQNGTILIKDANEWKLFCKLVNGGRKNLNARLEADVNLGDESAMVGTEEHKYAGTFDGQGHTLTVHVVGVGQGTAPFHRTNGTTIKNLTIAGTVTAPASADNYYTAGLVGFSQNTTLRNCIVKAAIHLGKTGDQYSGGLVGHILSSNTTIEDCAFIGSITGDNGDVSNIAGLVAWGDAGTTTISNSYVNATYTKVSGLNPILRHHTGTISHVYYSEKSKGINPDYNKKGNLGEQVTAEQLKSGEVTKKLQNNRTDKCYWAQQLGEMPDFYNAADKSKANYVYYDAAKKGWTCDDFRLTDGQPLPIGLDFTAANVTYERKFNGTQKATLCLPYDLSAQGFKAYTFSGGNKNEVHFKEVDDKLTAYTPYYITANGMPQLGGRNIEVKAYKADKMTTPAAGYKFTGTVAGVSNENAAAANAYILQDDGMFHKVTTDNPGATVPAYHAYIICPPQASGAKQLSVVLDGETTGIGDVTNEATDGKNGPVYDLQGRRVADRLDDVTRHQLPAGVYIVGGRKVVVK